MAGHWRTVAGTGGFAFKSGIREDVFPTKPSQKQKLGKAWPGEPQRFILAAAEDEPSPQEADQERRGSRLDSESLFFAGTQLALGAVRSGTEGKRYPDHDPREE